MVKKNKKASAEAKAKPMAKLILISESEASDLEAKYLARLADFTVSAELVNGGFSDFYDQEIERAKAEQWEKYLRCDGLPPPNSPVEVRTFIAKMRHFDKIDSNCSLDWTLTVDNRSILNQNIFRVDKTRRVLDLTKDNPGKYYDVNVRKCLDTLQQMDVMMENEADMDRMTRQQQLAIMEAYTELQLEINQVLNRLTYRVLKMQGAYMDTEDDRTAYWSFKGNQWEMDLWGLLNVPIRFDHLDMPVMLAELKASGVELQIPRSVLSDCLTIRSVHTDFDNVSHKAKSFEPTVTESLNFPNAGIVDILESVQSEWAMLEDLRFETLSKVENRRQEYEDIMQLIALRTEQAAKAAQIGEPNTNIVIPKAPKEPPVVPPGMVLDVYHDFIKMEDSQYMGYLDEVYHPRNLDMREHEINLRECIMLGGIYSVIVIRRPEQTQFERFNIILHEDGRVVYTLPDLKADLRPEHLSIISQKSLEDSRSSKLNLEESDVAYFIVTLQLPADLCKWSQPQVCHLLSEQESVSIKPDNIMPGNLNQGRANSLMSQTSRQFSLRGSVDVSNIFRPSIRSLLLSSKLDEVPANKISLENFNLQKPLEHDEVRQLERHCMPRIISSFKMPRDILDEIMEVEAPKSTRCMLVKRAEPEDTKPHQEVSRDFNFDDQNDPERLFPIFPKVEPIEYTYYAEGEEPGALFEETAMGLLKKLDHIKTQYYGDRANQLWNQREFVEKKKGPKTPAVPEETMPAEKETAEKPQTSKTPKAKKTVKEFVDKKKKKKKDPKIPAVPVETVPDESETADKPQTSKTPKAEMTVKSGIVETDEMHDVTHWTTRYITDPSLDQAASRITFKTDRLGTFGLAFKRYEHFPFRDWSMQPNEDNPDEIILTVDTFHVRIFFYITTQGVRGYVTDLSKAYTAKTVKYLEIEKPISDFGHLRQMFISKNINIFAENDASYYIENGYFSMKHVASEQHIYNIMGLHCKLMKFYRSSWNRLASRRDIIMNMKIAKDSSEFSECTVRITPEKTTFVQISEKCSDEVNVIVLAYTETWRNISNFTDLHQAVTSMVINATEIRNRDSVLLHYVTRLLKELRPLCFS